MNDTINVACEKNGKIIYKDGREDILNADGFDNVKFCSNNDIVGVIIPEGVKKLCSGTFDSCGSLASIYVPASVTKIEAGAFSGCSNLENIEVSVENNVYKSIENSIVHVESKTLVAGSKDGRAPEDGSVTSIGDKAFFGYKNITELIVPECITNIGTDAYGNCPELAYIYVEAANPVYYNDGECLIHSKSKTLVLGCKNSIVPADGGVRHIGYHSFAGRNDIKSLVIPKAVKSIAEYAFVDCKELENIVMPKNMKSIGESAFKGCDKLASINIPNGVKAISKESFAGCASLSEITLPKGIKTIGESAFKGCVSLADVTLLKGVKTIGENAFADCNALCGITVPKTLVSVEKDAFYGCNELTVRYALTRKAWREKYPQNDVKVVCLRKKTSDKS